MITFHPAVLPHSQISFEEWVEFVYQPSTKDAVQTPGDDMALNETQV